MNTLRTSVGAVALLALLSSCATPAPPPAERPRGVGMSLREATTLVAAFEEKQVPASKKLAPPATMEDALGILKSDRLDAFPSSVQWLSAQTSSQTGYEALALKAQTLLAWGEAELTVAEVLARTADRLEEGLRALQVRKLTPELTKRIDAERARIALYRDTDEALRLLAAEHVGAGVDDAQKVIAQKPDDYVGYRIAADAHRLRNEWREFSAAMAKVEEKNPDSNGLVFLRGVAAQMRDGDATEAMKLYRQAVERDPAFVRAQAQLVLVQTSVFEQRKELLKLKEIAPDHQIVRWAGPGIEEAYQSAVERQEQIQQALTQPKTPPGKQP